MGSLHIMTDIHVNKYCRLWREPSHSLYSDGEPEGERREKQGQVGQQCVLFEWTFFMNEHFLWMNEWMNKWKNAWENLLVLIFWWKSLEIYDLNVCVTDQQTDRPTDWPTDRQTDMTSFRDARTHLKTERETERSSFLALQFIPYIIYKGEDLM